MSVDIALLVIRLIIGTFFIRHGVHKFLGPHEMAEWLNKHGYKPAMFWVWILIITEFFGGVALVLGIGTKLFAMMMSVVMVQGIYHRKYVKELKFIDGWEVNYVTLASTITLVLLGAGEISLGAFLNVSKYLM